MKEKKRLTISVKRYGYQYILADVSSERKLHAHLPSPCFMGNEGYVLQSFHKIQK